MYLNLLYISIIIVFIIDISGVIDEVEYILGKWLKCKTKIPKPISCSLCSVWWIGLLYIIIYGKFTLFNIMIVAIYSILTPIIKNLIIFIKELFSYIIDKLFSTLK